MIRVTLPDGRVWLRVADPDWVDPLDSSYARSSGGRWNPPRSFSTLYLNGDVPTARAQIDRLLYGSAVRADDLDDDAYVLVPVHLPGGQTAADAVSAAGLRSLGLPADYPLDSNGHVIPHGACEPIGASIQSLGVRGVWCRSAAVPDGRGRELAWFPATSRSVARPILDRPLPFGRWRNAAAWTDIGFEDQPEPS